MKYDTYREKPGNHILFSLSKIDNAIFCVRNIVQLEKYPITKLINFHDHVMAIFITLYWLCTFVMLFDKKSFEPIGKIGKGEEKMKANAVEKFHSSSFVIFLLASTAVT